MERRRGRPISPFEDPRIVMHDSRTGLPFRAGSIAQVFAQNVNNPEKLAELARRAIEKRVRGIKPDLILSWVQNEEAKIAVETWCRGKTSSLKINLRIQQNMQADFSLKIKI